MLVATSRGEKVVLVLVKVFSFISSTTGAFAVPFRILSQKKQEMMCCVSLVPPRGE